MIVAGVIDHEFGVVAPLEDLVGRQLLEPLVLGSGVALGGAGQDGAVVDPDGGAAGRGDAQDLGSDWKGKVVIRSRGISGVKITVRSNGTK